MPRRLDGRYGWRASLRSCFFEAEALCGGLDAFDGPELETELWEQDRSRELRRLLSSRGGTLCTGGPSASPAAAPGAAPAAASVAAAPAAAPAAATETPEPSAADPGDPALLLRALSALITSSAGSSLAAAPAAATETPSAADPALLLRALSALITSLAGSSPGAGGVGAWCCWPAAGGCGAAAAAPPYSNASAATEGSATRLSSAAVVPPPLRTRTSQPRQDRGALGVRGMAEGAWDFWGPTGAARVAVGGCGRAHKVHGRVVRSVSPPMSPRRCESTPFTERVVQ